MRYRIEAFDKHTDHLAFEIELPADCDAQLSAIMNWHDPQRGDEGYNLTDAQRKAIERLTGKDFYDDRFLFQLTCNIE